MLKQKHAILSNQFFRKKKSLLHKNWKQKHPVRKSQINSKQLLRSRMLRLRKLFLPSLSILHAGERHLFQLKHWPGMLCRDTGKIHYDLNILFLIVYQPLGQHSHPWNAPHSAEPFHFPSPAAGRRKQHCSRFSHQITFSPAIAFRISLNFGSMWFCAWIPQC